MTRKAGAGCTNPDYELSVDWIAATKAIDQAQARHDDLTRRGIADWLRSMQLESAGALAEIDRYIGYWKKYSEGHADLDKDTAFQQEVRSAALTLREAVLAMRAGRWVSAGGKMSQPREK